MHSRNAKSGKIDNAEKHKIISSIHEEGYQVEEVVFSLHEKEREAFSVERMLIENLRNAGLTNIVGGVVTNEELVQQQAICLLSRLKSFEEWIISAKPYQLTSAQKMRGSERACYDSIRHELLMISQSC